MALSFFLGGRADVRQAAYALPAAFRKYNGIGDVRQGIARKEREDTTLPGRETASDRLP
jgi:hypothetical protein